MVYVSVLYDESIFHKEIFVLECYFLRVYASIKQENPL